MNGGTYSEALKVGFNEEQAGFLGRLGGETRNEAVKDATDKIRMELVDGKHARQSRMTKVGIFITGVIAAGFLGLVAGAPLTFMLLFIGGYGLGHAAR